MAHIRDLDLETPPLGLAMVTLLPQGAALGWHRTAPFGAIADESSTNSNVQNQPTERLHLAPLDLAHLLEISR